VPKNVKCNAIARSVVLPECCKIVNIAFDKEYGKEILKIPMLENTISRRVQDIRKPIFFAIQLDESTDTPAFSRFVRFEVFTAVTKNNAVFSDVAPCRSRVN
jgi:hypothetical protein